MGRPARHSADALIDAAISVYADAGARAVTMAAVGKIAGAPSGSVYHRFPDRPTLLASMWLRTARRFQAGWFTALDADHPIAAVVASARYSVDWCRENLQQATVLYAGKRAFDPDSWPAGLLAEVAANEQHLQERIRQVVASLTRETGLPDEDVLMAFVDVPYAAVHRYLEHGQSPPQRVTELVDRATRRLLKVTC